jgi:hypothetical protein
MLVFKGFAGIEYINEGGRWRMTKNTDKGTECSWLDPGMGMTNRTWSAGCDDRVVDYCNATYGDSKENLVNCGKPFRMSPWTVTGAMFRKLPLRGQKIEDDRAEAKEFKDELDALMRTLGVQDGSAPSPGADAAVQERVTTLVRAAMRSGQSRETIKATLVNTRAATAAQVDRAFAVIDAEGGGGTGDRVTDAFVSVFGRSPTAGEKRAWEAVLPSLPRIAGRDALVSTMQLAKSRGRTVPTNVNVPRPGGGGSGGGSGGASPMLLAGAAALLLLAFVKMR